MYLVTLPHNIKLLILGILILLFCLLLPLAAQQFSLPRDDFFGYWTAIRFNALGQNPYDEAQLFKFQDLSGAPVMKQLRYPPWVLPLWMPFGLISFLAGRMVWFVLSLSSLLLGTLWVWRTYEGSSLKNWQALSLAITFTPAIFSLMEGQVNVFIFLGLSGFLYFTKREDWILAGLFAGLISIKLQLLYLFWPALLFWSIRQKNPTILLSALSGIIFGTLLALFSNHNILGQYIQMLREHPPESWKTATSGAFLCWLYGAENKWLQFIPSIFGGIWFIFYWRYHRSEWDWAARMPTILFACILTTPFAWLHDEIVLIIPLINAYAFLSEVHSSIKCRLMIPYFTINIILLFMLVPWHFQQTIFIWLPWTLLAFYLLAFQTSNKVRDQAKTPRKK
jgi:hypothetical protein